MNYETSGIAPFSQDAEEAVLGSVFINSDAYFNLASFLRPEDFYILRHAYIWEAMMRVAERNEVIDLLTVREELRAANRLNDVGGPGYLTQLTVNVPTSVHAEVYGRLVERAAVRRRLLTAADEIRSLAMDETLALDRVTSDAETRLFRVTERNLRRDMVPMREAMVDYFDRMEHLMQNPDEPLGLPTGFRDFDALMGGLQRSDLLIFAGRPGMGKCVTGDTLIPTEHGLLPIAALKPSGSGEGFTPLRLGVQTPDGVRYTSHFYDSGMQPTLRIVTRGGRQLEGTLNHPVLKITRGDDAVWASLDQLSVGDHIAISGSSAHTLTDSPIITHDEVINVRVNGLQHCYDLTLPDNHSFISNGIVSHNTSFLLSVALNAAKLGARILIFTMEMGNDQIVQRFVSMETGINTQRLRLGQLDQQEWTRFVQATGRLGNLRIYIDDSPAQTPLQMRTKCRRLAHEIGLDLVIVDYLQLMTAGAGYENNRVQEISYISRNLKELAREINVPVFSAAQLSRAVESRQDKRPMLSDLRESGCLAGDTLIYLPRTGERIPIRELAGKTGFEVLSLNTNTWKLEPTAVTNAFCTGTKPVYKLTTRLGREIRATGNHKFLTLGGWKRLDELTTDDHIALPRVLATYTEATMTDSELGFLGHLLGDGCTLPTHAIQYTTREAEIAEIVVNLAKDVFGERLVPRFQQEKGYSWYQVFFKPMQHLTHGVHNPIRVWLEDMNAFGLRSYEKRVPSRVFQQPTEQIAIFLRHIWATDGCINMKLTTKDRYPAVYYASSSRQLAEDVQTLLLRLEINARIKRISQGTKGRDQFHVTVSGSSDLRRFVELVGAVGSARQARLEAVAKYLDTHPANTNRDVIPSRVWRMYATPAMASIGMTSRQMQAALGNQYCGTGLYKQNISRERAARLAEVVDCGEIRRISESDVYWDEIISIEPDGESYVYDLTVPPHANFVAENIIVHNSIEQDSDVVVFLYRDAVYNEATEFPSLAELIVAKHRNGPTGTINLHFEKSLTKFSDARTQTIDLSSL